MSQSCALADDMPMSNRPSATHTKRQASDGTFSTYVMWPRAAKAPTKVCGPAAEAPTSTVRSPTRIGSPSRVAPPPAVARYIWPSAGR